VRYLLAQFSVQIARNPMNEIWAIVVCKMEGRCVSTVAELGLLISEEVDQIPGVNAESLDEGIGFEPTGKGLPQSILRVSEHLNFVPNVVGDDLLQPVVALMQFWLCHWCASLIGAIFSFRLPAPQGRSGE
jgi:hypothetical protein